MILNAIFNANFAIQSYLWSFLPSVDPSVATNIDLFYSSIKTFIASSAWIFPVDTFFSLIRMVFIIELSFLQLNLAKFAYNSIHLLF